MVWEEWFECGWVRGVLMASQIPVSLCVIHNSEEPFLSFPSRLRVNPCLTLTISKKLKKHD